MLGEDCIGRCSHCGVPIGCGVSLILGKDSAGKCPHYGPGDPCEWGVPQEMCPVCD